MKRRGLFETGLLLASALTAMLAVNLLPVTASAQAPAALQDSDCPKCHAEQPADVAAAGEAHQDVSCQECHEGHRPASEKNIPECSMCHEGETHFELKGCLGCHTNPHTPLIITLKGNITEPCLTCHDKQIAKLKENKSKHTDLFCSKCHDVHGKIPECVSCHKPHSETMVQADCGKCHQAHMPTVVAYDDRALNKDCGSCHKKAFDLLTASTAKHKTKACVFCHKTKHKTIAGCDSCHGTPHPKGILNKFPKCGDCHKIAHDLNNWPAKKAAPAKKTAPAKKKK